MPVGIIVAAVGLGLSIYQTVKADKDKKKAAEEYEKEQAERQDIVNPYKQMSKYPTEAFAMRKEAADVELSSMVSLAGRAGRGLSIVGTAGDVYDKRIRQISADQEKYEYERDKLIAGGEINAQNMREDRENLDIAGWAQLYGASDQNKNNAMISMGNSAAYGAEQFGSLYGNKQTPAPQDDLVVANNKSTTASEVTFDTGWNKKPYN